jgi:hypothetical protein
MSRHKCAHALTGPHLDHRSPDLTAQRASTLWKLSDLHCDVLPGVDDGPGDMDGSIDLARIAVAAGTRLTAATPHVALQSPIVPGELRGRVAELQEALGRAGVSLEVVSGGELAPNGLAAYPTTTC